MTTEYFTDWRGIRRPPMSLPHIKPGQRRCCLILLDNASIHHCHEFDKRVTAIPGASVRFIPPYCHALSPLDNGAFGALVRWLQRHHDNVQQVGIAVAMEIVASITSTATAAASLGAAFGIASTCKGDRGHGYNF